MASFVQLKAEMVEPDPSAMIIRSGDYLTVCKAETILENAKRQSEKIIKDAGKVYEEEKKRGYKDGQAKAQGEVAEQILEIVTRSIDYLAAAESDVARVVMICVQKILGEYPDQEVVIRAARNALQSIRNEPRVTLRVCVDMEEDVRNRIGEILKGNGEVNFLEVFGDKRLKSDSCRLESEAGIVDASIDIQLKALRNVLNATIEKK